MKRSYKAGIVLAAALALSPLSPAMAEGEQDKATRQLLSQIEGDWLHSQLRLAVRVKDGVATISGIETSWPRAEAMQYRKGLVVFRAERVVADRSGNQASDRTHISGQCWVERSGQVQMKPCLATLYAGGAKGGPRLMFEGFFLKRAADFTPEGLAARR